MDDGGVCGVRESNERGLAYQARLNRCKSIGARTKWAIDICGDVENLELATTTRERLKGLLFSDPDNVTRLLIPCRDVHTFGMKYPLDIAFISKDGKVLRVHRDVAAMKRLYHKDASLVAERFSRKGEWLKEGDVIRIGTV